MKGNTELRKTLITEYLRTVLDQLTQRQVPWRRHNSRSLQQLGRALEAGIRMSRLEEGLATDTTLAREGYANINEALELIASEQESDEFEDA